jgi:hypothetical protein
MLVSWWIRDDRPLLDARIVANDGSRRFVLTIAEYCPRGGARRSARRAQEWRSALPSPYGRTCPLKDALAVGAQR